VTASKFVTRFTDSVALKAKAADINRDGSISPAEAKNLPVDLQDNFANFKLYR